MKEVFAILSGVFCAAGFLPYIWAVLKKKTKPSKASWIIWGTLDAITLAGMWAEDALNVQIIISTLGASSVALLSLKYGTPGWELKDKFCLGGAVLGIWSWWFFTNPLLGIIISLATIVLGSAPIFIETWKKPTNESAFPWIVWAISAALATAAVPKWSPEDAAQPITFLCLELTMVYLTLIRPRKVIV